MIWRPRVLANRSPFFMAFDAAHRMLRGRTQSIRHSLEMASVLPGSPLKKRCWHPIPPRCEELPAGAGLPFGSAELREFVADLAIFGRRETI